VRFRSIVFRVLRVIRVSTRLLKKSVCIGDPNPVFALQRFAAPEDTPIPEILVQQSARREATLLNSAKTFVRWRLAGGVPKAFFASPGTAKKAGSLPETEMKLFFPVSK
jgi:hypothetical protein